MNTSKAIETLNAARAAYHDAKAVHRDAITNTPSWAKSLLGIARDRVRDAEQALLVAGLPMLPHWPESETRRILHPSQRAGQALFDDELRSDAVELLLRLDSVEWAARQAS